MVALPQWAKIMTPNPLSLGQSRENPYNQEPYNYRNQHATNQQNCVKQPNPNYQEPYPYRNQHATNQQSCVKLQNPKHQEPYY